MYLLAGIGTKEALMAVHWPHPVPSEELLAETAMLQLAGTAADMEMEQEAGAIPRSTGAERTSPDGNGPARAAHILHLVPLYAEYHIMPLVANMTDALVAPERSKAPPVPLDRTGPGDADQDTPSAEMAYPTPIDVELKPENHIEYP